MRHGGKRKTDGVMGVFRDSVLGGTFNPGDDWKRIQRLGLPALALVFTAGALWASDLPSPGHVTG